VPQSSQNSAETRRPWWAFLTRRDFWLGFVGLAVTGAVAFAVVYYWEYIRGLGGFGYLGVFLIGVLGGATYIAPIPMTPVVFALGTVLKPAFAPYLGPVFVGLAAGVGEAVGGLSIYMTGYGGGAVLNRAQYGAFRAVYLRLLDWMEKRGSLLIFLLSVVLNPFFYPAALIAGATRYSVRKFILISALGKIIKGFLVAAAGYWGLGSILRALGVPI